MRKVELKGNKVMKRMLGFILFILCAYAIYYDLTIGTLPGIQAVQEDEHKAVESTLSIEYIEIEVKPGDTVLSIIEQNGGVPAHFSIEKIVTDFSELNEGINPTDIQPGKTYKFPIYDKD